jgi:hypothetical protein
VKKKTSDSIYPPDCTISPGRRGAQKGADFLEQGLVVYTSLSHKTTRLYMKCLSSEIQKTTHCFYVFAYCFCRFELSYSYDSEVLFCLSLHKGVSRLLSLGRYSRYHILAPNKPLGRHNKIHTTDAKQYSHQACDPRTVSPSWSWQHRCHPG